MRHIKTKVLLGGIPVALTRKKMKNIRANVSSPDANVKVSAPYWVPITEIENFVIKNRSWILSQQEKIQRKNQNKNGVVRNGAKCFVWGKEYEISIVKTDKSKPLVLIERNNILKISLASSCSESSLPDHVNQFYKSQLADVIPRYLPVWEERMGVTVNRCSIKTMKTRWGSCNPRLKKINLNSELAKYPVECLQYVIVHELAHFYELNHSNQFWQIVESAMPQWKTYHDMLNRNNSIEKL